MRERRWRDWLVVVALGYLVAALAWAAITAWGRHRGWPACPDPYDGRDLCPRGQLPPRAS